MDGMIQDVMVLVLQDGLAVLIIVKDVKHNIIEIILVQQEVVVVVSQIQETIVKMLHQVNIVLVVVGQPLAIVVLVAIIVQMIGIET
jgi:hypothetical protein